MIPVAIATASSKPIGKSYEKKNVSTPKHVITLLLCAVGILQMGMSAGVGTGWAISDYQAGYQIFSSSRVIQNLALGCDFLIGLFLIVISFIQKDLVQVLGMSVWISCNSVILVIGVLVYWLPVENAFLNYYFYASIHLFYVVAVTRIVGISVVVLHFLEQIFEENDHTDCDSA